MRAFAVSDLHTDFAENRRRLQQISSTSYSRDALVVADDIVDDLRIIDWTLRKLRSRFGAGFYVPGNHELWGRDGVRWLRFDGHECCLQNKRHDYEKENTKFIGSAGATRPPQV
jgi:hypothetical protein